MASKRKSRISDERYLIRYGRWEWQPWTISATIVLVLGVILYACAVAGAYPNNPLDALYRLLNPPAPAAPAPPVAQPPAPAPLPPQPEPVPAAPLSQPAPATPIPWPSPPVVMPPPVVVLPPIDVPPVIVPPAVQDRPAKPPNKSKLLDRKQMNGASGSGRVPGKPKQKVAEGETNEWLPSCSLVCWYAAGKTRAQLEAEAKSRNPTAAMRRHALACLARCGK